MASNQNKFIDRSPSILAAGKLSDNLGDNVRNCMREYKIDDAESALKYVAKIDDKANRPKYKSEPYKNKVRQGIFTEIRPILRPEVKTRFETLINELKETSYQSHWNQVVGKSRDPVPGLPRGLNPLETTFGKKYSHEITVKELVNPPKTAYQVLSESQAAHDLYRKTHNDYNPGERVCRNYLSPPYDSTVRFGGRTKYDPRGIWVRCACSWYQNEPTVFTNQIQADFFNKNRSSLGEVLRPINIANQMPKDFVYGRPCERDELTVEDLLKDPDCPQCEFRRDLKRWLTSFNKLKLSMKKRCCPEFKFNDLYKKLLYHDVDKCGTLPLDTFYQVCACYRFTFDRANLEPLLRLLSIVCEERINYGKFLEIVDFSAPPFHLVKIKDIPEEHLYYLTTTQAANCDFLLINNASENAAGIPSVRYDLGRPVVPASACRADLDNLGDECSSGILLNPSIYINYGLSFRDFFIPRERQVIRRLFEKIGYQFDDDTFERLWKSAVDRDGTGLVCVDTFNKLLLTEYGEHKKVVVDEATC